MKAIVLENASPTLTFKDVPDPVPGPGEAVVSLHAAALNRRDLWIVRGQYPGIKFPIILGSDGAGVLETVGEGVSMRLETGDEVIINPSLDWGVRENVQGPDFSILGLPRNGTFAEKVCVPARNLAPMPSHLTFAQAAALPLAGLTAFRALFVRAKLQEHHRILITGIGGGVASFGLQFAAALRAKVFVTSGSQEKLDAAIKNGALGGVLYSKEGWQEELRQMSGGFDVVLDSAAGEHFNSLIDLAQPGGRIVFPGATLGNPAQLDWRKVFWKQLSLLGTTMGSTIDFATMTQFVGTHSIVPDVDSVRPLAEASDALARMGRNQQNGKLVLDCTAS